MTRPRHTWQLILFTGAILIPSVALVVVGRRAMQQNRELLEKHRLDQQDAVKQRIASELRVNLEALKRAVAANPEGAFPGVALVARVEAGHLLLPWELDRDARTFRDLTARPPAYASVIAQGEQAEFAGRAPREAAAAYSTALERAATPFQSAYARLLLARVLEKQRRTAESLNQARKVLRAPPAMVDEDGVPLCVHAAVLLLGSPPDRPGVRDVLLAATRSPQWHSPSAAFALSNLAADLRQSAAGEPWVEEFRARTWAAVRLQEQAQSLQNDAGRLGLLEPRRPAGTPVWTLYPGAEPWLVSPDDSPAGRLVVAAHASDAFRSFEAGGVKFLASTEPGGELLADSFPGLKIRFPPQSTGAPASPNLADTFYFVALTVLVAATAFGATLLWRSLRREMELAETRSQFVSSVSHELKTPLTAIRMFAETLQLGRSQNEQARAEYLETICNECDRLTRLVDDVLLFSKIEQGKNVYRFRRVPLAEIVRRVARTLSYPLAQHGFELRMDLDDDLEAPRADPDALEQAVLNLLTNAMKYSGASRLIEVRLARSNHRALLQVADYGVGIDAAELSRIFEKYYRAPTPENRSISGTGLGLTLVHQIVTAHGGHVDVKSEPGKGSTFTISLPLETQHEPDSGD